MIRQKFEVKDGTVWACGGCGAVFVDGWVEHPATCPMMRPVRCVRHDMILETCVHCYPAAAARAGEALAPDPGGQPSGGRWNDMAYTANEAQARRRFGPWVTAQYGGSCPGCGTRFEPGERIRADDDLGDFVCETCGSAES